jgi:hypothetical protein
LFTKAFYQENMQMMCRECEDFVKIAATGWGINSLHRNGSDVLRILRASQARVRETAGASRQTYEVAEGNAHVNLLHIPFRPFMQGLIVGFVEMKSLAIAHNAPGLIIHR